MCAFTAVAANSNPSPPIEREICRRLKVADMPTYFLDAEFMQAVLNTSVEDKPALNTLHFPLNEMVLCLPQEVSERHFLGFHVPYITFAVSDLFSATHKGDCRDAVFPIAEFNKMKDSLKCPCCGETVTFAANGILLFHSIMILADDRPLGYFGKVPMADSIPNNLISAYNYVDHCPDVADYLESYIPGAREICLPHKDGIVGPTADQDRVIPDKVFELIYKLLLVLNASNQPDRVEQGEMVRKERRLGKHHVRPALWSPRLHWRRGHNRNQPYGPRDNPVYRRIWIEPCLIDAAHSTTNKTTT